MQHAVTTLCIRNSLSADPADLITHITVDDAPHKRHAGDVVHPVSNEKRWSCHRGCRCQKSIDLFGKMLTVGIQKDHPRDLWILSAARQVRSAKPVPKSGLNCFAFALVLSVNNNFGAGFARALCRLIG